MKQVELRKQLAKARAGLYRFLGGLYIMEVDAETLANMKQMQINKEQAKEAAVKTGNWTCGCGAVNTGKFCSECGQPRP